jgi:hypothetical protein
MIANIFRLQLLGLVLLKELVTIPLVKKTSRLSKVRTDIKNRLSRGNSPSGVSNHGSSDPVPTQSSATQSSTFSSERIFCIKNERIIFKTLIDVNLLYSSSD